MCITISCISCICLSNTSYVQVFNFFFLKGDIFFKQYFEEGKKMCQPFHCLQYVAHFVIFGYVRIRTRNWRGGYRRAALSIIMTQSPYLFLSQPSHRYPISILQHTHCTMYSTCMSLNVMENILYLLYKKPWCVLLM